jgi:hypothetical protein
MKKLGYLVLAMSLAGCGGGGDDSKKVTGPPKIDTAAYVVTGTASQAVVTYRYGNAIQQELVTLPWHFLIIGAAPGQFYSISAQKQAAAGTLHVSIVFNETKTLSTATSTAPFGVASTSATCCD